MRGQAIEWVIVIVSIVGIGGVAGLLIGLGIWGITKALEDEDK